MYQIKEVVLRNQHHEKNILVIEFDQPEMAIVGEFLMTDAALADHAALNEINQVLSGEKTTAEFSGNRCALSIGQDTTTITDLFDAADGIPVYNDYEIKTDTLRGLIRMWLDKLQAFKKDQH
ncbi:hypothetical protein DX933_06550 [Ornithinibacillus gellani]|uniref:hypothetical protein n=1 Tax=Ornithinibacillus gellani TaxID=2293253 RepID=UPI000F46CCB6|nr:hypothetical protein [Ornithinibacillus gellani]TQS75368.1 hypothetical protein DX933_06550 [Ornithinibacillus gellani]